MNPVLRFWNNYFKTNRELESDSWLRDRLNRHVVGTLLNTFPRAATKMFSFSNGELARRVCVTKEGGSYRVLRAMYRIDDPHGRGDLLNRLLLQSPAAKAARNRRTIADRLLEECLKQQPEDEPVLVLALGGGDGHIEAGSISRSPRQDIYYCSVDKDDKSIEDNRQVMERHGLAGRGFVFTGDVTEKTDLQAVVQAAKGRFGVNFNGFRIAACHGIAEYMDVDQPGNDTLARMLGAVHDCMLPEGNLIISHTDFHDRVRFMERGLLWRMRMRGLPELAEQIKKAGWQIIVCEHEPMGLITMCSAVKSDRAHRRIDSPSRLRHPKTKQPVEAEAKSLVIA